MFKKVLEPIPLLQRLTTLKLPDSFVGTLRTQIVFGPIWGGGPAYGVLMNASTNTSAGLVSDDTKLLARNELSVQGGLGFEFPLSSQTGMQVGFTYSRGLSNNLNVESAGGLRGHWQGFYAFTGLRFKNTVEVSSARERAEEYLRFKNSGTSPSSESGEFSEANSF